MVDILNDIVLERPGWNMPLEHNVQLVECPAFGLGQGHEAPDEARHCDAKEDVCQLSFEVTLIGVERKRDSYGTNHVDQGYLCVISLSLL